MNRGLVEDEWNWLHLGLPQMGAFLAHHMSAEAARAKKAPATPFRNAT